MMEASLITMIDDFGKLLKSPGTLYFFPRSKPDLRCFSCVSYYSSYLNALGLGAVQQDARH
jgi:hypothetical protein